MPQTSSVFARFKRTNTHTHNNSSLSGSGSGGNNAGKSGTDTDLKWEEETWKHHRRDSSSILSLTTTIVTDTAKEFGANVRRSVSLRSRHNPTASGSTSGGSSTNTNTRTPFSPLNSASAVEHSEEEEPSSTSTSTSPSKPTPPPPQSPLLNRKISLTAKGLTSKFKSTEALPSLKSTVYLQNIRASSPPARERGDSMLVSQQPSHAPLSRKTSDQNRPGLQPQSSFSRDVPSSHGGNGTTSLHQASNLPQPGPLNPLNPTSIYQTIQETSSKRIATIDYMRKLHEGDLFYFGTIHFSQTSLHSMPSMQAHKLGRRATNYFLLGHSLPSVLDLNSSNPLEYLKALSALLTEFETYQSLCGFDVSGNIVGRSSRMGGMFSKTGMRSSKGRRSSAAITPSDLALDARQAELLGLPVRDSPSNPTSPLDMTSPINPTGHEFHFLMTPHIPFEPDFSTTLGTLCDTLIDTYAKLMDLVSGPELCSPLVGEVFSKADKAIRKILVANVVREFEETTRAGIKGEMAGLGKLTLAGLM